MAAAGYATLRESLLCTSQQQSKSWVKIGWVSNIYLLLCHCQNFIFRVKRIQSLLGGRGKENLLCMLRFCSFRQKQWRYSCINIHDSSLLSQLLLDNRPCLWRLQSLCGKAQKRTPWSSVCLGKFCKHNCLEWTIISTKFALSSHSVSVPCCLIP